MSKLCFTLLYLATFLIVANCRRHRPPPIPPTPAPSTDCTNVVPEMTDCLSFISAGSNDTKPSPTCCSGFELVLQTNPTCICEALKTAKQMGVTLNVTQAATLPASCGVVAPPLSRCNLGMSPGVSLTPAAAPGNSPSAPRGSSPSAAPAGSSPSVSPGSSPSAAPAGNSPSAAPAGSSPSVSPGISPSAAPGNSPNAAPWSSPSAAPWSSPSAAPATSPNAAPVFPPQLGPSGSPMASPPELGPSGSPVVSPPGVAPGGSAPGGEAAEAPPKKAGAKTLSVSFSVLVTFLVVSFTLVHY